VGGGAEAADALIEAVKAVVPHDSVDVHDVAVWLRLFEEVDAKLHGKISGETTGVVVIVHGAGVLGVSAGDSEAWLATDRGIDDLTTGQRRARLGSGRAAPISFHRNGLDGVLLVGTDGLFKYAPREKIAAAVRGRRPDEATAHLVELVRLRSGTLQDDVGSSWSRRGSRASRTPVLVTYPSCATSSSTRTVRR
jgi:hypothetical protein